MKTKLFNLLIKSTKDTSGQTIVESLMCSMIIMIILVGLLQIFHTAVASLITDYSAFRTARSYCVGFTDYLVKRSARVGAIGASGKLIDPDNVSSGDLMDQFAVEKLLIPEYITGKRWWMEYEYWDGGNSYDPQYFDSASPPDTRIYWYNSSNTPGSVKMAVGFHNYPFPFLDLFDKKRIIFDTIGKSTPSLEGSSTMINHASYYVEQEQ